MPESGKNSDHERQSQEREEIFETIEGIFSDAQLDAAAATLPTDVRKVRLDNIDTVSHISPALQDMRDILLARFPQLRINTSILKRYAPDVASAAYELHADPDEFMSAPLVLITLSGDAVLTVETAPGVLKTIPCRRGTTAILTDPTVRHSVTPPQNASGVREFLFFGYSTNQSK